MTQILEQASWNKQKSPLVDAYQQETRKIENHAAMLGFLYRPGFLADMTTQVEKALKYKLSEVNYKIVAEAIEREIAQTGLEYDSLYKNAMIEWELEKTTLLTSLEQEFADLKYTRSLSWEEIARLQAELDLRQIVLISTKADIDEQMETYRQELVGIDGQSIPAEKALLNAQVATANKKLTIIPVIETILEKERELLAAEEVNITKKETLIDKQEELIPKTEELQAAREELATNRQTLVDDKSALATKKGSLIAAKTELITKKGELVTAKGEIVDEHRENFTKKEQQIAEVGTLITKKELTLSAKDDTISAQTTLQTNKSTLAGKTVDLAVKKDETVEEAERTVDAMYDVATAKEAIADEKETTVGKMEGLQTAVDATTDEMTTLTKEKVATIGKKEALIPKYESISNKESDITAEETTNIGYQNQVFDANSQLLAKSEELISAKSPLLDAMQQKVAKEDEHTAAIIAWTELQTRLYAIKEAIAILKVTEVANEEEVFAARELLIQARSDLDATRTELQMAHLDRTAQLTSKRLANDSLYAARQSAYFASRTDREADAIDAKMDADEYISKANIDANAEINSKDVDAERTERRDSSFQRKWLAQEKARIATTTELTSNLVHALR